MSIRYLCSHCVPAGSGWFSLCGNCDGTGTMYKHRSLKDIVLSHIKNSTARFV